MMQGFKKQPILKEFREVKKHKENKDIMSTTNTKSN